MKHIIWSSDINEEDWEYLKEEYPDYSDDAIQSIAYEENSDQYYIEKENLNKELNRSIVMFADLGLWDGRRSAFKILPDTNLNACLTGSCGDYTTWFVENNEVCCDDIHHDGHNQYIYRVLKNGVWPWEFEEKAFEDFKAAMEMTEPLGPYVSAIYGWDEDD